MTREPRRVTFEVKGLARPKGSTRAFVVRTKTGEPRAVTTRDNPPARAWELLVAAAAQGVAAGGPFLGPVVLTIAFELARPVSNKSTHHVTLPDLDKLVRSVLDALTGVLYLDDKQVVELYARKRYASYPAGPGVRISVVEAELPDPDQRELLVGAEVFA